MTRNQATAIILSVEEVYPPPPLADDLDTELLEARLNFNFV